MVGLNFIVRHTFVTYDVSRSSRLVGKVDDGPRNLRESTFERLRTLDDRLFVLHMIKPCECAFFFLSGFSDFHVCM